MENVFNTDKTLFFISFLELAELFFPETNIVNDIYYYIIQMAGKNISA